MKVKPKTLLKGCQQKNALFLLFFKFFYLIL